MEQRDWELLDKQVRERRPPRTDGVIVLSVVAVFFAGMMVAEMPAGQEPTSGTCMRRNTLSDGQRTRLDNFPREYGVPSIRATTRGTTSASAGARGRRRAIQK